jgi:hypothetical protein
MAQSKETYMKVAKLLPAITLSLLVSLPAWAEQQTGNTELIARMAANSLDYWKRCSPFCSTFAR